MSRARCGRARRCYRDSRPRPTSAPAPRPRSCPTRARCDSRSLRRRLRLSAWQCRAAGRGLDYRASSTGDRPAGRAVTENSAARRRVLLLAFSASTMPSSRMAVSLFSIGSCSMWFLLFEVFRSADVVVWRCHRRRRG